MITLQPEVMLRRDYRVFARFARELLRMNPSVQRIYFGDDYKRKIDSLAVFVAAYEYAMNLEFDKRFRNKHTLPPQPKFPMLAEPDDEDDVPDVSLETLLYLRYLAYSLDIDTLDEMDAVDLQQERDWCDYWYSWYASRLDAS